MHVRVPKEDLINKLLANKQAHHDKYMAAYIKYKEKFIHAMKKQIDCVRKDLPYEQFHMIPPFSCEPDYDRAISMLNLSTDFAIQLDEESYKKYWEDDWAWKDSWRAHNAAYHVG